MCLSGSHLVVGDTNFDLASRSCVYSIPVGKAAYQMAAALGGILGDQLVGGVVSGVVLAPVANTATTNNIAMATKQTLSPRWRVFARGLARHAPQADQVSLIISDTEAGEEWNVASGPTLEPPPDGPDARAVVARYDFAAQLPESIRRAIERAPAQTNGAPHDALRRHYVLKDNKSALEQAVERARALCFAVEIATGISEQHITEGCQQLPTRFLKLRRSAGLDRVVCLVSGGEFN